MKSLKIFKEREVYPIFNMFVKKITLKDHPLILNETVEFSIPNGKSGSGINYVVGRSGVGKTYFLEKIFPNTSAQTPGGQLSINTSSFPHTIELFDETGNSCTPPIAHGSRYKYKRLKLDTGEPKMDYLYPSSSVDFSDEMGRVRSRRDALTRQNQSYAKTSRNSGFGEARFNRFKSEVENIVDVEILCIEEPEGFLDPISQTELLELLSEIAKTKQIFVSTHSPYMIDWGFLENGASIVKLNRVGNESKVGVFCNPEIVRKINNPGRPRPHLNGVETKNIFFSNKVLVVEGQDDVGLISSYLESKNISEDFVFFGYGAGGCENISAVLEMCKSLNIPKVAALFDLDPLRRAECYEKCRTNYSPEYQIEELKAEDIRDKQKGHKSVDGAFDEHFVLKDNDLGKDFEQKIELIINYFNS